MAAIETAAEVSSLFDQWTLVASAVIANTADFNKSGQEQPEIELLDPQKVTAFYWVECGADTYRVAADTPDLAVEALFETFKNGHYRNIRANRQPPLPILGVGMIVDDYIYRRMPSTQEVIHVAHDPPEGDKHWLHGKKPVRPIAPGHNQLKFTY